MIVACAWHVARFALTGSYASAAFFLVSLVSAGLMADALRKSKELDRIERRE